jgi:SAM-dependent methyltransferase
LWSTNKPLPWKARLPQPVGAHKLARSMDARSINKTMDREDLNKPDCRDLLPELFGLIRRMQGRGARYSSWYGRADAWPSIWEHVNRGVDYEPWPGNPDELRIPWFLLWEIAWLVVNTPMRRGARVLDMGGAGSLFTCYLASRGFDVHTIDLDERLCRRSEEIASLMNWRMTARRMDMTRLDYPDDYFDHVFSVCVFEHLPVSGRIRCNEQVRRVLRPGGTASYTFDYFNPQSFGRLDTPEDVQRQFVEPSKLSLRGDGRFHDNGKRYLASPQCFGFGRFTRAAATAHAMLTGTIQARRTATGRTSYTMGSMFLEKRTS